VIKCPAGIPPLVFIKLSVIVVIETRQVVFPESRLFRIIDDPIAVGIYSLTRRNLRF
jgi:hypothetical protein